MTTRKKLALLLADDHVLVREGLKRLIDDQPDMEVIAEAADGHFAVRLAEERRPDVAVVDVSMPGLDGTQVTRLITTRVAGVKVIALTRHDDASFVRRLLDAGAMGYVLKQSASTELTCAIRSVASGERYIDSSIRPLAPLSLDRPGTAATPNHIAFTEDEEALLRLVAGGRTNGEIGAALSMELGRVLALRTSAMSKGGLSSRAAVVRYAQARGWLSDS